MDLEADKCSAAEDTTPDEETQLIVKWIFPTNYIESKILAWSNQGPNKH